MLDDLGLNKRDNEGYRLLSNGQRLALTLTGDYAYFNIQAEMIIGDMKDLGIEVIYKLLDPTAFGQSLLNNEMQLIGRLGPSRMTLFGRGYPDQWALETTGNEWGRPFVEWKLSKGERGVEPPAEITVHTDKWAEFVSVPSDSPKAAEFGKEYFQYFADELLVPLWRRHPAAALHHRQRHRQLPARGHLVFASDNNFYHPYYPELWYRK